MNRDGWNMPGPMKVTVNLKEGMTFEARDERNHIVAVDTVPEKGGNDTGTRPTELLLMALGSCTGMDVMSILRKKRAPVQGLEVQVEGERAEAHPGHFVKVKVTYIVKGPVEPKDIERAIELSRTKYCPVMYTVEKAGAQITTEYKMVP